MVLNISRSGQLRNKTGLPAVENGERSARIHPTGQEITTRRVRSRERAKGALSAEGAGKKKHGKSSSGESAFARY